MFEGFRVLRHFINMVIHGNLICLAYVTSHVAYDKIEQYPFSLFPFNIDIPHLLHLLAKDAFIHIYSKMIKYMKKKFPIDQIKTRK